MTLLSTDELADEAGLSPATIRRYARTGSVPCIASPGGHRRFDRDTALAALDELRGRLRDDLLTRPDGADESDGFDFDPPATPRGPTITVAAEVRIRDDPDSPPSWLSSSDWADLEAVLDAEY